MGRGERSQPQGGGSLLLPAPQGGPGDIGPWERDPLAEQARRQRRRRFAVPPCQLATAGEAPEFHMLDPRH